MKSIEMFHQICIQFILFKKIAFYHEKEVVLNSKNIYVRA